MNEYEAVLMTEVKKAMQDKTRRNIVKEVSTKIKSMLPNEPYSRSKIGTHVRICIGVIRAGNVFSLAHTVRDKPVNLESFDLSGIDTTGLSKYAAKKARQAAMVK